MESHWRFDDPPKIGHYLASWHRKDNYENLFVSELFFNPDSIGHWWVSRSYLHDLTTREFDDAVVTVYAWRPIPEAPEIPVAFG